VTLGVRHHAVQEKSDGLCLGVGGGNETYDVRLAYAKEQLKRHDALNSHDRSRRFQFTSRQGWEQKLEYAVEQIAGFPGRALFLGADWSKGDCDAYGESSGAYRGGARLCVGYLPSSASADWANTMLDFHRRGVGCDRTTRGSPPTGRPSGRSSTRC
jgi:hypothetical protein